MEPGDSEASPELRVVLQLMKLAREMEMMQFFEWLLLRFEDSVRELPDSLIRKILLYALHAESDLDVERIAHT
ncbi:MAG: hypothetical protein ACI9R3_004435 [Verrucomicrobiales bacterium]|jgi:hypothetical protein